MKFQLNFFDLKKIDLKNFNFHTIFNENFRENFSRFSISKIFVGRFQNSLVMVLINRFGQNFVQNYVEFNGGGRGSKIHAISVRGRSLQKNGRPAKKMDPFRKVCPKYLRFGIQNLTSLPYPFDARRVCSVYRTHAYGGRDNFLRTWSAARRKE